MVFALGFKSNKLFKKNCSESNKWSIDGIFAAVGIVGEELLAVAGIVVWLELKLELVVVGTVDEARELVVGGIEGGEFAVAGILAWLVLELELELVAASMAVV
jgi:hypothetical protein